ncbi:MAG: site-specific DNA-methyltransferase, partial [Alphaproteobacteria bacterium]|nr:site-specific DNA-methyltransferase [Alphaproteobacteria bacterium]
VVNQFTKGSSIEHPAPFPEAIFTLPILQTTDEGDLVVDPFMGTGTTGKVANTYGRRFVGYDTHRYRLSLRCRGIGTRLTGISYGERKSDKRKRME